MNFMWLQLRGSSSCKTGLTRSSFSVPMKCVLRVTAFWKKLVEKCPDADQQPLHHRLWLCRCVYIFNCMYAVHQTHLKHESAAVGCLQQTVTLDSHLIFLESDSSSRSSSRSRRSSGGGSGSNVDSCTDKMLPASKLWPHAACAHQGKLHAFRVCLKQRECTTSNLRPQATS